MRKTIGILAHVDAGKTTFSERVLYLTNAIRQLGRVDHQSAFLDAHPMERQRGITIFSGQANFTWQGDQYCWLDTPGHVDFASEMERAVAVMDYAVLIISCAEGVQSHTQTVWELLKEHGVPVFIFLNKIDRLGADPERVLGQIQKELSGDAVDLRSLQMTGQMDDALVEEIAQRDENLLETLFETGYDPAKWLDALRDQFTRRQVFPVMTGSALEGVGVEAFLNLMPLMTPTHYDETAPLTARVYQVRHDAQGQRVVFMKLLSGTLQVKDDLPQGKVNEIRLYHGEKYKALDRAAAGDMIAIPSLDGLKPGDGVYLEAATRFRMEPMMESQVIWDEKAVPPFKMMQALKILEEEEPALAVREQRSRLSVRVMGKIQLEILKQQLQDRWGYEAAFGPCQVLYKETVAAPCRGIGHYEPLKHYAEAHFRLLPGERGSGVTFRSLCHVDTLELRWQKLICSHVFERQHKGVLTGAPLTDVVVELLTGKAHLKHTEGGDFRQAVYRGLRNALMHGQSVLMEPVCAFSLRAPADQYGSLASALTRLQAQVEPPVYEEDMVTLTGEAFYSRFAPWQEDFLRLTHGRGALRVWMAHYAPCPDPQPVIEAAQYNPLAEDSPDSVFCMKGAGFNVPWDQVKDYAHLTWEEGG